EADCQYTKALELRARAHGPDSPELVQHISAHAKLLFDMQRFNDSLKQHRAAEAIERKAYGAIHSRVSSRLHAIGRVSHAMGDTAQAEASYKEAIATNEATQGGNHVAVATGVSLLGAMYIGTGRVDEAVPLIERALGIVEFVHGLTHPAMVPALSLLAEAYNRVGRNDETTVLVERARVIADANPVASAA
ncbi:MAG: tetratricopeptide repeat protein, partial [Alphaproteobacteria bacterium]|nr:tetratricopeptide repeat protein [Alphaproteobacteria bacterium]